MCICDDAVTLRIVFIIIIKLMMTESDEVNDRRGQHTVSLSCIKMQIAL
jgi:hypothetical protein